MRAAPKIAFAVQSSAIRPHHSASVCKISTIMLHWSLGELKSTSICRSIVTISPWDQVPSKCGLRRIPRASRGIRDRSSRIQKHLASERRKRPLAVRRRRCQFDGLLCSVRAAADAFDQIGGSLRSRREVGGGPLLTITISRLGYFLHRLPAMFSTRSAMRRLASRLLCA